MPSLPRTFSLRAHLLLLVIGTLLPAVVVAAFLVRQVVADNRDAVERRLLEAARAEAAIVDAELGGTIRALQGLAQSDGLTNGEVSAFYAQARRLLATQPTWSAVSLATLDGDQIAHTGRPLGDPLPQVVDRDSFDRAIRKKTPAIGNLRVGQVTHQFGFVVRVPAIRDGRVLYILSAWITSSSFATVLRHQAAPPGEWIQGVVDAGGVLVARSRDPDRFVGQKATAGFLQRYEQAEEGVYRDTSLDGTAVYIAFSRAPLSRWIAAVAVPASMVDAGFRQSMIALAVMAVLLIGFGAGGTYLISLRIARDISASAAEAEAIARGLPASRPRSRVTELQRLLDALARSGALLETRQRERDEQVARADAARAEAEAADRAKDEFLAMLGHELRNPLAPALTGLHLMKVRGAADTTRERDIVERQIRHMARLVDDLLDVSRLRRGNIELRRERFDVADAVARAVEMTTPLFAEKQHHLEVDVAPGLVIDGDRIRIAQVLSNLLSNAAKYTEPRGHVVLRARDDHGQVVVECCDNGIGLAPDLVPRVFDLFVQGQRGLDRRQGGLGLGLAVARTLVELHGGTIEARSAGMNQGTTFVVRLPLAAPAAASMISSDDPGVSARPQTRIGRVMIVDDNRDALETLVEAMTEAGHETFGASTSSEALDLAGRVHPEVAVLDIGLPDMSGLELARALRSRANGASLRLIALTGYGRAQDEASARAAGFDAFFVKPVDIPTLLDALEHPHAGGQTPASAEFRADR
jgi:signal transduction histidine kinase/ActR/RegA family two-component response regulator